MIVLDLNKFEKMKIGKMLDYIIDNNPEYKIANSETIQNAGQQLLGNDCSVIAITEQNTNKVVRVVANSDIIKTYIESQKPSQANIMEIANLIPLIKLTTEDTIEKLINNVTTNRIRDIVILNPDGTYHGVINKDKLRSAIDELVD